MTSMGPCSLGHAHDLNDRRGVTAPAGGTTGHPAPHCSAPPRGLPSSPVGWFRPDPRTIARGPGRPHPREQDAPPNTSPVCLIALANRTRGRPFRPSVFRLRRVGCRDRAGPRTGRTGIRGRGPDAPLRWIGLARQRNDGHGDLVLRHLPQPRGIRGRLGPRPGRRERARDDDERHRLEGWRAIRLVRQAAGRHACRHLRGDEP
jgi:hypothetical protein